jgi:uncharacterized protein YfeS
MKIIFSYFLLILVACKLKIKDTATTKTSHIMESNHSPTFDNAHPVAKKLMTDSFFFSPIEETAPFGSDDGSDTYASFQDWRKTHSNESIITFLKEHIDYWGYPKFDIEETDLEKLKPYLKQDEMNIQYMKGIDQAIVASAFGQLYLEGKIDEDIKKLAIISINRELLPGILKLWGNYENTRKENLNKLLSVLNEVK